MTFLERPIRLAGRIVESLVGVLAATGCLGCLAMGVLIIRSFRQPGPHENPDIAIAILALSIPVGIWCGTTAWRLFTGRERERGGGLLSPFVLVLCGVGAIAGGFAIASQSARGAGGLAGFLLIAMFCFSMAGDRWRSKRRRRR